MYVHLSFSFPPLSLPLLFILSSRYNARRRRKKEETVGLSAGLEDDEVSLSKRGSREDLRYTIWPTPFVPVHGHVLSDRDFIYPS